jgi:hypothetical protein
MPGICGRCSLFRHTCLRCQCCTVPCTGFQRGKAVQWYKLPPFLFMWSRRRWRDQASKPPVSWLMLGQVTVGTEEAARTKVSVIHCVIH